MEDDFNLDDSMDSIADSIDFSDMGGPTPLPRDDTGPGDSQESGQTASSTPASGVPAQGTQGEANAAAAAGVSVETWRNLPKSWKAEHAERWSKIDPDIQKYVHEREWQVTNGIKGYKEKLDAWENIHAPYKSIYEGASTTPQAATERMLQMHHALAAGTNEQKVAWLNHAIQNYGLEELLKSMFTGQAPGSAENAAAPNPEVAQMRQTMAALNSTVAQLQEREQDRQREATERSNAQNLEIIEKFAKDPAHKYFEEVGPDIALLIKNGSATSLQEAYDMACAKNPAVRMKQEEDRITALRRGGRVTSNKVVRSSATERSKATPDAPVNMETTMNETFDKIFSKH